MAGSFAANPESDPPAKASVGANASVVVALLFFCVAWPRLAGNDRYLGHDEAISLLVSTGHVAEFAELTRDRRAPFGVWVDAAQWQRLLDVDDGASTGFAGISSGLRHHDIHPPLYFWLLHGALRWGAPGLLNVILAVLAAVATGLLVRESGGDRSTSLGAAAFVLVSSVTLANVTELRQYTLFSATSVLLAWAALRVVRTERFRAGPVVVLAVTTALALLTHVHAVLVVLAVLAALAILAILALSSDGTSGLAGAAKRLLPVAGGMAGGGLLAFLTFPGFSDIVQRAREQLEGGPALPVAQKLAAVAMNATSVFSTGSPSFRFGILALTVAAVGGFLLRSHAERRRRVIRLARVPLLIAAGISGAQVLLFLSGVSPAHSMGARYAAPWIPFVAAGLAFLLPVRAHVIWVVLLLAGALSAVTQPSERTTSPVTLSSLHGAKAVVVNTAARGLLVPVVNALPAGARVLVGDPRALVGSAELMEPGVHEVLLVSFPAGDSDTESRRELNRRIAAIGRPELVGTLPHDGRLFRLQRVRLEGGGTGGAAGASREVD